MQDSKFSITNKTKARLPSLAFAQMKDAILGKDYELSLVIVGKKKIKELNKQYRDKNEPTDILSFPISEDLGEIYINPEMTKIEAKKFGRNYENFIGFLFIHGLTHLKGMDHGSTMESIEARFRKQFGI